MTTTPDTQRRERIVAAIWPHLPNGVFREEVEAAADAVIAAEQGHAAEVRAAAFDQAADAVQSDGVRLNTAATEAAARRGPVALIAHVQAAVADHLRRMAAAVRPDNTTGA